MRCWSWIIDVEPLGATQTLAVDIMGLTLHRVVNKEALTRGLSYGVSYPEGSNSAPFSWLRKVRKTTDVEEEFPMLNACAKEIVQCHEAGTKEVILVVGNDDDMSEITLVPLDTNPDQESGRFRQARRGGDELQRAVNTLWLRKCSSGVVIEQDNPPKITVMTVQRAPLQSFTMFRKLPKEIQTNIWEQALRVPRVIEIDIVGSLFSEEDAVVNRRVPALLHVSRSSRAMALKHLTVLKESNFPSFAYYNPKLDIILVPGGRHSRILSPLTKRVSALGILSSSEGTEIFSGQEAKSSGAKDIYILGGRRPPRGWLSYEVLQDQVKYPYPDSDMCEAWYFMDGLNEEMAKVAKRNKKWKETLPRIQMARIQQYHIGLQEFGRGLGAAAQAVFPNEAKSRYTQVFVLTLCWEDEDPPLPVTYEISRLFEIFSNVYNFNTEIWKIPDKNCHARLNQKILDFVLLGDDSPEHLKIVYYAGHARLTKNRLLTWTSWRCNQMEKYPTVKWSGIQNVLEEALSDALILLDCCAGGAVNTLEGNGVTELVAACGYNAIANGVGLYSFTNALILELQALSNRPSFTVAYFYNNIYSRIQGRMPEDGRERHPPPIHLVLTQEHQFPRSIQLSRCRFEINCESTDASSVAKGKMTESRGSIQSTPVAKGENQNNQNNDQMSASQQSLPFTHVLRLAFAIRLKDTLRPNELRTDLFVEWLRTMPTIAEEVKVEAEFDSFSSLVIISMPVAFSTFLPRNRAIMSLGPISNSLPVLLPATRRAKPQIIHSGKLPQEENGSWPPMQVIVIPNRNTKRSRDGKSNAIKLTQNLRYAPRKLKDPVQFTDALRQIPEDGEASSSSHARIRTPLNAPKTAIPSSTGTNSMRVLNVMDGLSLKSQRRTGMLPPSPPSSASSSSASARSSLDSLTEESEYGSESI